MLPTAMMVSKTKKMRRRASGFFCKKLLMATRPRAARGMRKMWAKVRQRKA